MKNPPLSEGFLYRQRKDTALVKKLEEMTLPELWRLFPVRLVPHDPRWGQWYARKKEELSELFSSVPVIPFAIHHIGSTAVPDIQAKPIIDILIEWESVRDMKTAKETLIGSGYRCMSETPKRISLNDGYTEQGYAERVFHLHLRLKGDRAETIFRDYLISNPDIAKEYERLKLKLQRLYEYDRDGYTSAKTAFIKEHTP